MKKLNMWGVLRIPNSMKRILSLVFCAFLGLPASAQGPAKAEKFTLANGMTLIVAPDRRAPTAMHMLW
ncbi:MAG: hypothetical protein HY068_13060, partial [Burkholderiales bacterium]|nr:hypothetical protein [Burkholderiales bacterium]